MGLFSSQTSYIGVDLGSSSIKVAELANYKGRPRLVTYGFTEKKVSEIEERGDILANTDETAATLSEICRKANISSKKVIAALPNFSVFTAILNLPSLPKKELASAISWEAKKIIPLPLEEIILDWKIINEEDDEVTDTSSGLTDTGVQGAEAMNAFKKILSKPKKNLKILLTGASKKLVKKYIDIFNKAGLSLLSLETESFATVRSLIGNDKSAIMLIDLGALTSNITIVDRGIPVISRSMEEGGLTVTRSISNSLNINLDRAEQFKQDLSLDGEGSDNSLPQTVESALSPVLNEIKYTLNLYQDQNNRKVEKIILTGGAALLGNLSGYLSRTLSINTYLGDPWARVVYPTEVKPILDRLGPRFSVAVGLAMRDIS